MNISSVSDLAPQIGVPTEPVAKHTTTEEDRTVIHAVKAVNAADLFGSDHELTYKVDTKTRRVVARIVKRDTGELIREIPNEYVTRLAEEIKGR